MKKHSTGSLIFCLLIPFLSFAAPKPVIDKTAPFWVKAHEYSIGDSPKNSEISFGYYFSLYDEQINLEEQTVYTHSVKHITNETGISENSQIAIGFNSEFQQLYLHTLSVIRDGKVMDKLRIADIKVISQETELNDLQYTGLSQAMIVLEDVRKGDRIDLAYSIKGSNPVFKNKYSENIAFVAATPVMNFYTSIMFAANRRVNYRLYNNSQIPDITSSGGYKTYSWNKLKIAAYDNSKDLSPSWFAGYPYAELTEYNNWDEVASWCLDIFEHYKYSLPKELLQKVDSWHESSKSDQADFALMATRFVQDEIRYYGMQVGEHTHRPHPPVETFAKRFGDCKDKSLLLTMILRSKGIKANIALVSTFYRNHLLEHLPAANRFNHVIVKAVINNRVTWIDPTISRQHGNLISNYVPNYGKVLVVDEAKSTIEPVYSANSGTIDITETFTVPEKADAEGQLSVLSTFTLGEADGARTKLDVGLDNIQREYENYYAQQFGEVKLAGDIKVEDDNGINGITIREKYAIKSIWESNDDKMKIEFYAKPVIDRLTNPAKADGTSPIALYYPLDLIYTQVMNMPSDWSLGFEDIKIENEYYSFSFTPRVVGSVITMTYTLTTHADNIPVSYISDYKKEYKKISDILGYSLTYNEKLAKNINSVVAAGGVSNLNWIMLFICLVVVVGANLLFIKFNKQAGPYTSHEYLPPPIDGWLILLAIGLSLRPILYLWSFYQSNYMRTDVWMTLNALGNTGLQLYFIIQMVVEVVFLIYSCWIIYWFFRRRDIFPRFFVIMALAELGINVVFYIIVTFSATLRDVYPSGEAEMLKAVIRSVVFVAIWVTAIVRAEKVKDTFIRPYKYGLVEEELITTQENVMS